jgi:hypothetical protein
MDAEVGVRAWRLGKGVFVGCMSYDYAVGSCCEYVFGLSSD